MARWTKVGAGALAAATLAVGLAPAASAKDGDVRAAGTCTGASTSKLKLSREDGRIEVELEVDQNRNGVRWAVSLRQNGRTIAAGTRITKEPSGSFTLRVLARDTAAADRFAARATRSGGETCTVRATLS